MYRETFRINYSYLLNHLVINAILYLAAPLRHRDICEFCCNSAATLVSGMASWQGRLGKQRMVAVVKARSCPRRRKARSHLAAVVAIGLAGLLVPAPATAAQDRAGADAGAANAASSCTAPRDLFFNPFTYRSAHHRPIGSGALYARENDPTTQSWLRGRDSWRVNSNNGWGRNAFLTTAADPETLVNWSGDFGVSKGIGEFGGLGLPTRLRVTVGAANGRVSDSIVILVDDEMAQEFYRWWDNDGAPTAAIRRDWSLRDTGHGSSPWQLVGVSASGQAGLFGLLRGFEINTPGQRIEHVLTSAIPPSLLSASGEILWPATGYDGCVKQGCTSGTIPYGALFALPPPERGGPDLATLGLSEPGLRLAEALRDYGTYVQDKGANLTLPADQHVAPALIPALNHDLNIVQPYLRMVTNNARGQEASGGGSPRAANCAFDAP